MNDVDRDGKLENLIPLISIKQEKGESLKIRLVLDFRYLNDHIISCPGSGTPLCQNVKIECCGFKESVSTDKGCPFFMVLPRSQMEKKVYVLPCMGFGLNIVPKATTKSLNMC